MEGWWRGAPRHLDANEGLAVQGAVGGTMCFSCHRSRQVGGRVGACQPHQHDWWRCKSQVTHCHACMTCDQR